MERGDEVPSPLARGGVDCREPVEDGIAALSNGNSSRAEATAERARSTIQVSRGRETRKQLRRTNPSDQLPPPTDKRVTKLKGYRASRGEEREATTLPER